MHDTPKLQEIELKCWSDKGHETGFDSALTNFIGTQPTISSLKLALNIDMSTLMAILGAIAQLKTLFLGFPNHPSSDGFDHASALLPKLQPNLECFYYSPRRIGSSFPIPQSLFDCCGLKRLTLGCIDLGRLDHATIEKMGKAWRQMESLELLPSISSNHTQGISPAMLQHIAAAFAPSLRQLTISIAFGPGFTLTPPTSAVKFPELKLLNVGQSIIPKDSLRAFVEFLSAITPPGFRIKHTHGTNSDQREIWDEVDDFLQMAQRIRNRARLELLEEQHARYVRGPAR